MNRVRTSCAIYSETRPSRYWESCCTWEGDAMELTGFSISTTPTLKIYSIFCAGMDSNAKTACPKASVNTI